MCANKKQARARLNMYIRSKTLYRPVAYYYATQTSFLKYLTTTRERVNSILGKLYGMLFVGVLSHQIVKEVISKLPATMGEKRWKDDQTLGISFVYQRFLQEYKGVIIGDECGLGKTLQAIGAAYLIYLDGKERKDPRKVGFVYKSKGLRDQLLKELKEFRQALEDNDLPPVCVLPSTVSLTEIYCLC